MVRTAPRSALPQDDSDARPGDAVPRYQLWDGDTVPEGLDKLIKVRRAETILHPPNTIGRGTGCDIGFIVLDDHRCDGIDGATQVREQVRGVRVVGDYLHPASTCGFADGNGALCEPEGDADVQRGCRADAILCACFWLDVWFSGRVLVPGERRAVMPFDRFAFRSGRLERIDERLGLAGDLVEAWGPFGSEFPA